MGRCKIIRSILLLALLLLNEACTSKHPWEARPSLPATRDSFLFGVQGQSQEILDRWTDIQQTQISLVKSERARDACNLLGTRPFVALSGGEETEWADDLEETSSTLQAFLVRGVSYDSPPIWVRAFLNEHSGELWVQQCDWTLSPRLRHTKVQSPVVVLLPNAPTKISVTAHRGESVLGADPLGPDSKSTAFWLVECDYQLKH